MKTALAIIFFFTVCYLSLVLNRFWQFEYFFTDNVFFDTALWQVANLKAPIVLHEALGVINILGDHFHPTIFLLSPFYRLFQTQETILVLMVLFYSISAFVGTLLGFKLVKRKGYTLLLLFPYFLYLGVQNAFIYGFHEVNLFPLFFMLTVFFLISHRIKLYILFLVLTLLTKESFFMIGISLGIFIFIAFPKDRKLALGTVLFSILYFFVITKAVIPSFSGRYLYGEASFSTVFLTADLLQKLRTFFVSLGTFGFLPLLNPATLFLCLQDFIVRFAFQVPGSISYTLDYHYNLVLAPIFFFSSLWSISKLELSRFKKIVPILLIVSLVCTVFFLRFTSPRGPILLVFNKAFYQTTKNNAFLWDFIESIPKDGSVSTQNHLGYPLSHQEVYQLPTGCDKIEKHKPKYIAFDLREGQNPNNFNPITKERLTVMKDMLLREKLYILYFQEGSQYILKSNSKNLKGKCLKF